MNAALEKLLKPYLILLITSLGLVACGGGDPGPNPPPPPPPTVPAEAILNKQTVGVNVQVPASLSKDGLKLETVLGSAAIASDGSGQAQIFQEGPQFTRVLNANNNPVLMGWARPGNVSINVNTTAQVLMYFDVGAYLTTTDLRAAIMNALATSPDNHSRMRSVKC